MSRTALRIASLVLGLAAALPAAAQNGDPKPRSSSPSGIEVRPDAPAARPKAGTGPAASAPRLSSPAAGAPAGTVAPAAAASAVGGNGGGVSISGNTVTNAQGSDLNTATVGQGNAGCTHVGTIAGRGC